MSQKIEIPVEAKLNAQQAEATAQKLGRTISNVGRQKIDPVPDNAVKKVEALFEAYLKLDREMARRLNVTGQKGRGIGDIDWSSVYQNDRTRSAKMKQLQSFMKNGGADFEPPNQRGGGGFGRAAASIAGGAAQAGLRATGPAGGVAANALGTGMSAGFGAGLMGLVGGMAALGVGKLVGMVTDMARRNAQNEASAAYLQETRTVELERAELTKRRRQLDTDVRSGAITRDQYISGRQEIDGQLSDLNARGAAAAIGRDFMQNPVVNNGLENDRLGKGPTLRSAGTSKTATGAPAPPSTAGAGKPNERVKAFVQKHGPLADKLAKELNVPADAILGQWGLETGWGRSVIPGTNNLGNIKDFSGKGPTARDNMTGSVDSYRAYGSSEAFGEDFKQLLSKKRYAGALGTSDPTAYFSGLKRGGYAEDPNYVRSGVRAAGMVARARTPIPDAKSNQAPGQAAMQKFGLTVQPLTVQHVNSAGRTVAPTQELTFRVKPPAASFGDRVAA